LVGNSIEVSNLTKVFNEEVVAVDGVSFEVKEREVFGFLGPNGAGKTTTINILTTVLKPTSGKATVCGYDVARNPTEVRRNIAVVPQEYTADEDLSAYENVMLCSALYDIPTAKGRKRTEELLSLVGLDEARHRKVETFSGGMRRRLEIACGLVSQPRVLFLDEPTLGLDVQARTAIWRHIRRLKHNYEMTLFLTTHYLEEADRLCDRIALIHKGRIVKIGSPTELKASLGGDIIEVVVEGPTDRLHELLDKIPLVREVHQKDGVYRIKAVNGDEIVPQILDTIRACGAKMKRIWFTRPTLDEVYLEYVGRSLRDEDEFVRNVISKHSTWGRRSGRT